MTLSNIPVFTYGEMLYIRYSICADIPFTHVIKANMTDPPKEPDMDTIRVEIVRKLKLILPPGAPKPKLDPNKIWGALKASASQ